MNSGYFRTAAILTAMLLGTLIPAAHVFAAGIRPLIMLMLFSVFLQMRLARTSVHRSHFWLLLANLVMGFVGWGLGWLVGGRAVALATFFSAVTPTASAAPVITSFLRGRVDYVIASFLITNVVIAALIPVILPLVVGHDTPAAFTHVLGSVGLIVFVPLILAWCVRRIHPAASEWPVRWHHAPFGVWILSMFLITANASEFVRVQVETPHVILVKIVFTTMVVCAANFALGWLIGGREFPREASQSLGQKNTSFTIYLALTYASPLVALGPTCYVICHNLWNSWQLHAVERGSRAARK